MSLSDSERRSFEELEAQLRESDPVFARKISSNRGGKFSTRKIIIGTLMFLAGIIAMLAGISTDLTVVGIAGFVLMGAGVYLASSKIVSSHSFSHTIPTGNPTASPFMKRLEDSWEERRRKEES